MKAIKPTTAMIIISGLLIFNATTEAAPCSTAWNNADRVQLHQLYQKGLRNEITAFKRYHRAKLNECNSNVSAEWIMDLHYLNDSEINYNANMHQASRY